MALDAAVSSNSFQPRFTWIVVLICEAVSSFTLAALMVWLVADRWSFYRLQRQQQQQDAGFLTQIFEGKAKSVLPTHIEHHVSWSIGYLSRAANALHSVICFNFSWPRWSPSGTATASPILDRSSREPLPQPCGVPRRSPSLSPARQRWRRAITKVILILRATRARKDWDRLESECMTNLEPIIRNISMTEEEVRHEAGAATSGLQFHPEGSSLAICGRRLSMMCELGVRGLGPEYTNE